MVGNHSLQRTNIDFNFEKDMILLWVCPVAGCLSNMVLEATSCHLECSDVAETAGENWESKLRDRPCARSGLRVRIWFCSCKSVPACFQRLICKLNGAQFVLCTLKSFVVNIRPYTSEAERRDTRTCWLNSRNSSQTGISAYCRCHRTSLSNWQSCGCTPVSALFHFCFL